jgi:thiol-disulfide isomerase/thioredoxin
MKSLLQKYSALLLVVLIFAPVASAQTKSPLELFMEIDGYVATKTRELTSAGKRVDAAKRESLTDDRKSLAAKYAAELASRPGLSKTDFYYLGRLFGAAGNEAKVLEWMKRFLAEFPPDARGDMIQSGRALLVVAAVRRKLLPEAETAFQLWKSGDPMIRGQQPALQDHLALGYYKAGEYDSATKHAQEAFDVLKQIPAKTLREKRDREQIYMNLTEVLAMSYKRSKNSDLALAVLAEARVESFALPSAELYRKVMTFVEGSGFSEKKLMQKVNSIAAADPAPEMKFIEWIGEEQKGIADLRGHIVLLDFWATWCGPCIVTFPRLRSWHKKYADKNFKLIGVTQYYGQQEGKKMSALQELDYLKDFKQKHKLPYDFALIPSGEAQMKYGINAYPTTVLLDRNGVVRYIGIGSGREESENLEEMIEEVLAEDSNLAVNN